jgi:hypothetical protein
MSLRLRFRGMKRTALNARDAARLGLLETILPAGLLPPLNPPQAGGTRETVSPAPTFDKPAVGRVLLPAESESEVPHETAAVKRGRGPSPVRESGDPVDSEAGSGVSRRALP